ncbi:MAG: hypothetical protein AAF702_19585 [Chloroflexota bacterium]
MFGINKSNSIRAGSGLLVSGLISIGLLLRAQGISWQPLWWDEGYSIYFATQPISQLLNLTAQDIHPPLYYVALQGWIRLLDSTSPEVLRLLSILFGCLGLPFIFRFAYRLFSSHPRGKQIALLALLLLTINPFHLYYSQEIRMYGLAVVLTLWSTIAFWQLIETARDTPEATLQRTMTAQALRLSLPALNYVIATTLSLYTLYYSAFIPVAHLLFTIWVVFVRPANHQWVRTALFRLLGAQSVIGLLYLPWVLYASPKLVVYIQDKVIADNDTSLGPLTYLGRHLITFLLGHLPLETYPIIASHLDRLSFTAGLLALLVGFLCLRERKWLSISKGTSSTDFTLSSHSLKANAQQHPEPVPFLWFMIVVPTLIAFALNQRLPFFPVGGERLLLMVLPYVLILFSYGVTQLLHWGVWTRSLSTLRVPVKSAHYKRWLAYGGIALLLTSSTLGIVTFQQTPRYTDRDYQNLIHYVMTHSGSSDQVLALFPWQVGYWRAYAPEAEQIGPQIALIDQSSQRWGEGIRSEIDTMLDRGRLWFPAPLGLGSDLPKEIEAYIQSKAAATASNNSQDLTEAIFNVDALWANPTTFLTSWYKMIYPPLRPLNAKMEHRTLTHGNLDPAEARSNNSVVAVGLRWSMMEPALRNTYQISIRLQDDQRRIWAKRNYLSESISSEMEPSTSWTDWRGLTIPVGVPPGLYEVVVEVSRVKNSQPQVNGLKADSEDTGSKDSGSNGIELQPITAQLSDGTITPYVFIGTLNVTEAPPSLPLTRIAIESPLLQPQIANGVAFLGSEGALNQDSFLAGTEVPLWLFIQNQVATVTEQQLYVSLLDQAGNGVAGWAEWPLPAYPLTAWPLGRLLKMPASLQLPATVPSGEYKLITGLLDPATGQKSPAVELGMIGVKQRASQWEVPSIQYPIAMEKGPWRLGTHVELLGSDLQIQSDDSQNLTLRVHWHVLQTLLPQHHIFIHLVPGDSPHQQPLAQHDAQPSVRLPSGDTTNAPTGSWLPGEYLTTVHELRLPDGVHLDSISGVLRQHGLPLWLRAGLYIPETGVRLPTFKGDTQVGDSVPLVALEE